MSIRASTVTRPEPDPSPGDLSGWRWIVVNSSGGKDSQTALRVVVEECDRQCVDRSRIVVSHQCLGRMEWRGTRELVERQAAHYGLRVEVSKYRDKEGTEGTLLDYVRKRQRWPDNKNRYCTSDFKRGPGRRIITKLYAEAQGPMLNVFGFRAEESPARKKKIVFAPNLNCTTKSRQVWDWLPIHDWTEAEVWQSIRSSNVPYHDAYDLGMPRLSCCFCIFAPRDALLVAGRANPDLLNEYCELENEIGHTFQNGRSINSIRDAIRAGEQPKSLHGAWNM
jgi:3'-phosphoadenosine 5'-phosphosulfate sulfotransferase (PAPS reductase)/FAD synthetase